MLAIDETGRTLEPWQRRVVWTLVAALANPATVLPLSLYTREAVARDTDIYLSTTYAGSTAEPAIMLILDTSDSMNATEGWREYPGAYDSHVEYLWNDIGVISNSEVPLADANRISTAAAPVLTKYGSWSGDTLAQRQALWTAAKTYANATEAGDLGARNTYRNYNNANWIYWLPAGTDEADKRLQSNAFNRWAGGAKQSSYPAQVRGGVDYGATDDYRPWNKCNDSLAKLLPSTVFAPTIYPRNSGKYLNQQWQRWERYLDLIDGRLLSGDTTYPTTLGATQIPSSGSLTILAGSAVGAVGSNIRARSEFMGSAGGVTPYPVRDSYPRGSGTLSTSFGSNVDIGDQGQPIRTRGPASRSGWTDLKADLGGFVFQGYVNGLDLTQLVNVLSLYDIVADTTTARHKAWKGNRDASTAPAFGKMTGTPAYYDFPGSLLKLPAGAPTTTTLCTRTCEIDADPGVAGKDAVFSARDSGAPPKDGDNVTKYWVKGGATCVSTSVTGSDCSTEPVACAAIPGLNNSYKTINNTNCRWTGRSSKYVEGVGTYYYGGTCSGSCRGQGFGEGASDCPSGRSSPDYCVESNPDLTIGSTVYPDAALASGDGTSVGCVDKVDTSTTCEAREGLAGCRYVNSTNTCVSQTRTSTTTVVGTDDYTVYPFAAKTDFLEHDCKADNGTAGNPGSGFLTAATNRTFGQGWNDTSLATGATASYAPADPSASYPAVDMYSVNYLNWKFGPKGPTNAPIGRKSRLQIAKDALTDLVNTTDGVRFGLTVYNKMPSDVGTKLTEGSQGGNVAYAIRRMGSSSTDSDYVNRASLVAAIDSVAATATTPLTEVVYEVYLYFRGETPLFGTNTTVAVGGGQVSAGRDPSAIGAEGKYISPMMSNPNSTEPATCQKNYVVLVSDGGPENDNQADTLVRALTQAPRPPFLISTVSTQQSTATQQFEQGTPSVPYGPTDIAYGSNYVWLDELTYFMANGDMSPGGGSDSDRLRGLQKVKTFTIGFAGGNSEVLKNAATKGDGINYLANDSAALAAALKASVATIRDWNPTIAAPTVPLSASNRSQSGEDAYLAFFGPNERQCWNGTVKKYKFRSDPDACGKGPDGATIPLCLTAQDKKNIEEDTIDAATSLVTAKVRDDARSYWTSVANDGGFPDKGGTGELLQTSADSAPASRKLYTYLSGRPTSDVDLTQPVNEVSKSNDLINESVLGDPLLILGSAARATILNYARGGDPANTDCSDGLITTVCSARRTWTHGDVLHSVPASLIYETGVDRDPGRVDPVVYLFYMSNDGVLHAVDTATGQEQWAFMPEENLPKLQAIRNNGVGEHLIAGDGTPRLFVEDVNLDGRITASDKAYLVFGMRRGGRAYYALDVADRSKPRFMWKIDNTTPGFAELGETWSTPAFARSRATTLGTDPLLVFGGGYDPVANDQFAVTLTRSGTTATVTAPIDHGFLTGQEVKISGAREAAYNGTVAITVTSPRSFTYTVDGAPSTPATGTVRVESNLGATMGRGIFFVNGRTGELLRSFTAPGGVDPLGGVNTPNPDMIFSIPSDATPVNSDLDAAGYVDRLYIGDLGGNVWRFDIDSPSLSAWSGRRFADLTNGAVPRRKIFFPPATVKQDHLGQRFDAVYVGTGDRESPLRTDGTDMMFMIKDLELGLSSSAATIAFRTGTAASDFYDLTANLIETGSADQRAAAKEAIRVQAGWVMKLEVGGVAGGEKVVNAPSVFYNVLRFGTYSPVATASECVPPGKGTMYSLDARDGRIVADTNHDGVVNTSDSRAFSDFVIRGFPSDSTLVFREGKIWDVSCADGNCRIEKIGTAGAGQRAYWFQEPER